MTGIVNKVMMLLSAVSVTDRATSPLTNLEKTLDELPPGDRRQFQEVGQPQRDGREEDQLADEGHDDGPGMAENFPEILEPERQPQVEHQEGQDGEYNPDGVHTSLS